LCAVDLAGWLPVSLYCMCSITGIVLYHVMYNHRKKIAVLAHFYKADASSLHLRSQIIGLSVQVFFLVIKFTVKNAWLFCYLKLNRRLIEDVNIVGTKNVIRGKRFLIFLFLSNFMRHFYWFHCHKSNNWCPL